MSKNKLYNKSYFIKRVLEAGFFVTKLDVTFEQDDMRKWMVLVNSRKIPYKCNICITCFKNKDSDEFFFKFQGQSENEFTLKTKSMTTIIGILNDVIRESEDLYFSIRETNNGES